MGGLVDFLNGVPLVGLMGVIAVGFTLGRLSLRRLSLGPAGGTLFVGLLLGALGLGEGDATRTLGTFGFVLFIYSVGFDAAPHFFSAFRGARGWSFVVVAAVVNLTAVVVTVACARLCGIDGSSGAGLLAGALTSAPTFAAASEFAPDPTRLSVAFAMTYPIGLVGLVLVVQVLPWLIRQDLAEDAASDEELDARTQRRPRAAGDRSPELTRAFLVRNEAVVGRDLATLRLPALTGCVVSRVHRRERGVLVAHGETVLQEGDRIVVTGRIDELQELGRLVGPESDLRSLEDQTLPTRRVQVRRRRVVGRTLAELEIGARHRCVVTRIERGRFWIEPDRDVALVRDDVLVVVGERANVRSLSAALGRFEPSQNETDIAVYALGMVLGLLIGSLRVPMGGLSLTLGKGGGLLLVGLCLGWARRLGPLRTNVPVAARQLVRDLGILLFVGDAALRAGGQLDAGLRIASGATFLAASLVVVTTAAAALVVGRALLRLRPVDAWGSLCGGLTSSAGLAAARRAADSNEVAIAYAAAYAPASILATLAGPLVVAFT